MTSDISGPRPAYDLTCPQADYPGWNGAPRRTLIVCTQQRSGSTLLGEALYAAGGLGCPLEYYHAGFRPALEERWGASGHIDYTATLHRNRTDPSGVFSIKLFWRDLMDVAGERAPGRFAHMRRLPPEHIPADDYKRLLALLSDALPAPHWISLRRRDAVRQAVSIFIATKTGRWRNLFGAASESGIPDYQFAQLLNLLRVVMRSDAHWRRFFEVNGLSPIELAYEDLDQDYGQTMQSLLATLGRADAPIGPPRLARQRGRCSEMLVTQFKADLGL